MPTSVLWIVRFQNVLRNTLLPYFNKIEECHPSDLQLRWLQTRKPLAYRESTRIILSVTYHYENMVYSVLKHIDTTLVHVLECIQSADDLLHVFIGLWQKEYFLTSNPFSSAKSSPLVLLPVLIFKYFHDHSMSFLLFDPPPLPSSRL